MIVARSFVVLVALALAGGCSSSGEGPTADAAPDGPPIIMAERFTSATWSLSIVDGAAQLSITDGTGAAACALSGDHHRGLGAAGMQILVSLPGTVTGPCPVGGYSLIKCAANLGDGVFVPAGCGFFRRWSADGTSLGIAAAISGEITFAGTATSCSLRANVGFLGTSFAEMFTLTAAPATQPWCASN